MSQKSQQKSRGRSGAGAGASSSGGENEIDSQLQQDVAEEELEDGTEENQDGEISMDGEDEDEEDIQTVVKKLRLNSGQPYEIRSLKQLVKKRHFLFSLVFHTLLERCKQSPAKSVDGITLAAVALTIFPPTNPKEYVGDTILGEFGKFRIRNHWHEDSADTTGDDDLDAKVKGLLVAHGFKLPEKAKRAGRRPEYPAVEKQTIGTTKYLNLRFKNIADIDKESNEWQLLEQLAAVPLPDSSEELQQFCADAKEKIIKARKRSRGQKGMSHPVEPFCSIYKNDTHIIVCFFLSSAEGFGGHKDEEWTFQFENNDHKRLIVSINLSESQQEIDLDDENDLVKKSLQRIFDKHDAGAVPSWCQGKMRLSHTDIVSCQLKKTIVLDDAIKDHDPVDLFRAEFGTIAVFERQSSVATKSKKRSRSASD